MAEVFVSYSSLDRNRVASLVEAIERRGWTVWWDRNIDAGTAFDREIEQALDDAKCVVVVWSASSIDSDWVRNEANEGLERGVLVPVLVESVRPPLAFRRTQTIDFTSSDDSLELLLQAIARICPPKSRQGRNTSPFVGRQSEQQALLDLIRRAKDGEGGFALLSGEAGVGKTRLVQEAMDYAEASGALVLSGRCEVGGGPPYQPIVEQIDQALRKYSAEAFQSLLGENAPEMSRLVPEIRNNFPGIPELLSLPPDQERRYILHGCGEFIDRVAQTQFLTLVFEDLHWAGESTCRLLRYLAERLQGCPLLLIGTYRDTDLATGAFVALTIEDLLKERLIEEIQLSQLDKPQVSAMLEGRGGQLPPDKLVSLIFEVTEGNPFFIEEIYRYLDESGQLFGPDGKFITQVSVISSAVPRGVRLTIENRLAQVSDNCRQTLGAAAVKGRSVDYTLLKHICDLADTALLDALEEAEQASLLVDVSVGREARYQFVHELTRQTLIGSLSLPRRQRIHVRIADAMEDASTGDTENAELAFHLYQAGSFVDSDRTLRVLLRACKSVLNAAAFEEALELMDMADEVVTKSDRLSKARISSLRAQALIGSSRIEDALDAMAVGIGIGNDLETFVELLQLRAHLLIDLYRADEAMSDVEHLLGIAQSNEDRILELGTTRLFADAYYRMSLDRPEFAKNALEACERTIELARSSKDELALASALILSGNFVDYWSDFQAKGYQNLREATSIAESLNDEALLLDCASMKLRISAVTPLEFGIEAEDVLEKLEAHRDPVRLKEHLFCMIHPARNAGHIKRSVELCEHAIEVAGLLGVPPVQYPTLKALGLIALGRLDEAWRSIEEEVTGETYRFAAALQRYGFFLFRAWVGGLNGVMPDVESLLVESRALNRIWMVEAIANTLITAAAQLGMVEEATRILDRVEPSVRLGAHANAELSLARGDIEQSLHISQDLMRSCDEKGMRLLAADAGELVARCMLRLERWEEAKAVIDRQIEFCQASEYKLLLWRLLAFRGQAHQRMEASPQAAEDYQSSRELLESLGNRILDITIRQQFLNQPLAIEVLEASN